MSAGNEKKSVLAINFGGLGDEVLFLPTLQTIRRQHPGWKIALLTEPRGRSVCRLTDLIDESLTFDIKKRPLLPSDYIALVALLRKGKFDIVLSSGASPQVAALLFLSGIGCRVGYNSGPAARLLLSNPVPLNNKQHAALMYHDLTCGLELKGACSKPEIKVDPSAMERMSKFLSSGTEYSGAQTVIVHPGMSLLALKKGIIKTWDPRNWAKLIADLAGQEGCRVVLAGGPDDDETVKQIVSILGATDAMALEENGGCFLNAYGQTAGVEDLAALINLSDLLVCVDSAPMHIGVGLNKSLVALFGPTDPKKLLWPDSRFVALRDPILSKRYENIDPFKQRLNPADSNDAPYIEIPVETVSKTVIAQLSSVSNAP